jgi:hypothetical protein
MGSRKKESPRLATLLKKYRLDWLRKLGLADDMADAASALGVAIS